jgi:6-phosphogluconolactonase
MTRFAALQWLEFLGQRDFDHPFTVALSGGRTPRAFYAETVKQARDKKVSFEYVHFFWSDERCVPPDDAESNFLIAAEHLFAPLQIAEEQIHRIRGECDEALAVNQAESEICRVAELNDKGQPVLDLVFLGVGEDGHVASLFPNDTEAFENCAVYRAITSPKPPPRRITLGYPALIEARAVWVLASGEGKADILRASLADDNSTPLARILSSRTHTEIFTDFDLA